MKCPICDGMGTSNTCVNGTFKPCSFCDGTGEVEKTLCENCSPRLLCSVYRKGDTRTECKDYQPMTNEEWFCGLSTEEKAKWLSRHSNFMYECGHQQTIPKTMYEEDWEWWLKEEHKGGEL